MSGTVTTVLVPKNRHERTRAYLRCMCEREYSVRLDGRTFAFRCDCGLSYTITRELASL